MAHVSVLATVSFTDVRTASTGEVAELIMPGRMARNEQRSQVILESKQGTRALLQGSAA